MILLNSGNQLTDKLKQLKTELMNIKFFSKLSIFLLVASMSFTSVSCNNDDDDDPIVNEKAPVISVTETSTGPYFPGDVVEYSITLGAESNLEKITVNITPDGGTTTTDTEDLSDKGTSTTRTYQYTLSSTTATSYNFEFVVEDRKGRTQSETKTVAVTTLDVNVKTATLSGDLSNVTATQNFGFDPLSGTLFNMTTGDQNQSDVHLVFYYGSQDGPTLAATTSNRFGEGMIDGREAISSYGVHKYSNKRNTSFKMADNLDDQDFEDADNASLMDMYTNATGNAESRVSMLEVGDIVAFKLDPAITPAVYGLVQVEALDATAKTITIKTKTTK